ncbi:MAG: AAA family ATPase [Nitrospirae bacterium]|nr:AAA family ATPase [Nitrospirota bacterium]
MPLFHDHRLLRNEHSHLTGKRIWVIHGSHLQDWYYHNLLYGCVDLRRTLELWAFENHMEFTVTFTRHGVLDFSGNSDVRTAETLFEGARPQRPPKYGNRTSQPSASTVNATSDRNRHASDTTQEQAQQAAGQAQQAAGGDGQTGLNTLTRLTQVVTSHDISCLVILEHFPSFINRQKLDPNNAPLIHDIIETFRHDWHLKISETRNVAVFITDNVQTMKEIFPQEEYVKIDWKETKKHGKAEIAAAIERLALRTNVRLIDSKAISELLERQNELLDLAVHRVINLINSGEKEISVNKILELPPINETELQSIKDDLSNLTGLEDVKEKVVKIEKKARAIRRQLDSGESVMQDEAMHLVFQGPPGTGKTTVARLIGRLFYALGLLRSGQVMDVIASTVMSSNVNETRENMQKRIEEARGGVLFIDEAHQFGDKDSLGAKEAIDALVPLSWNLRSEMVIILAGYADKIHSVFDMDQGLERRFPKHGRMTFRDYTFDELWQILNAKFSGQGYSIESSAEQRLMSILMKRSRRGRFGNAGGVENIMNEVIENHTASVAPDSKVITLQDLPPIVRRNQKVFDEAFTQLNSLLGLEPVKEKLKHILLQLQYRIEEEEAGRESMASLHPGNMRFVGPPGTGKTTVAQLMGKLLYGIGCIEKPACIKATRGDLVGAYQGHSAKAVRAAVDQARDCVLFIDEAYSLDGGVHDTFGKEATTELVSQITDRENAGTVFIIAGYKNDIDRFITTNDGLERRFPQEIYFPNFSSDNCALLAMNIMNKGNYTWEEGVLDRIKAIAVERIAQKGERFGNAGEIESLMGDILGRMMTRIIESKMPADHPDRRKVMLADLPVLIQL